MLGCIPDYGRRSFGLNGGLIPILSKRNAKETTLDYERTPLYRLALRFADNRGLHIVRVARTLMRDRLDWTLRQKQRLTDLVQRLRGVGERLGLVDIRQTQTLKGGEPMVAGITLFPRSIQDAVEDRVLADPAVKKQWEELSIRFRMVFADPETAFRAMNFEAVLTDSTAATMTLDRLVQAPATIGPLKGRTGLLAGKAEREARRIAEVNAPALKRDIEHYLRLRQSAVQKVELEEKALRHRVSIDIPALSASAHLVLEKVRDAIDRNDLPAALGFAIADRQAKVEIDAFNRAIAERFGERMLLTNAARDPAGKLFDKAAEGLRPIEKQKLAQAWPVIRTAQQLAAHERTAETLKQTENLRLTQRQSQVLKQ